MILNFSLGRVDKMKFENLGGGVHYYQMNFKQIFNQKGNSLIQVIVAAGIMATIAMGVASMMANQNKEAKAMGEKLLSYELQSQMKMLFENPDYCNCAFNGKTFDMTATPPVIVAADQFTRLKEGYSVPTPTCTVAGGDFIPTVGTGVPGSTTTVGSIGLGSLTLVSPGVYKANLSVGFNNSIRVMKPIKTNVQFSVNMGGPEPMTAKPFGGCRDPALATSGLRIIGYGRFQSSGSGNVLCYPIVYESGHPVGKVMFLGNHIYPSGGGGWGAWSIFFSTINTAAGTASVCMDSGGWSGAVGSEWINYTVWLMP